MIKLTDKYAVIRGIKEVDGQPMFNDDIKPKVIQLEETIQIIMQNLDIDTDHICHALRQNDLMELVDTITEVKQ